MVHLSVSQVSVFDQLSWFHEGTTPGHLTCSYLALFLCHKCLCSFLLFFSGTFCPVVPSHVHTHHKLLDSCLTTIHYISWKSHFTSYGHQIWGQISRFVRGSPICTCNDTQMFIRVSLLTREVGPNHL